MSEDIFKLPENFDPSDPSLWNTGYFCFNEKAEPFDKLDNFIRNGNNGRLV